jgi:hypothetical protein
MQFRVLHRGDDGHAQKLFPTEQPNFETIAIEAAHEDGEQNG